MTISEETRHQLHQRLDDVLGVEEAATLMAHLPPVGWADVATKRDLDHAVTELRSEFQIGLTGVRTELHLGLAGVRIELHEEIAGVQIELHKEIGGVQKQLQGLFFKLAALQVTTIGVVVALVTVV